MVPPYEEDRRDGAEYNIRDKVGGEVTPPLLTHILTFIILKITFPYLYQDTGIVPSN